MKSKEIVAYLDKIIPEPKCELNYQKDYELLLAVMLSAQTTDKRVNMVTKILFDKYPCLEDLRDADVEDIMMIIKPIGTFKKKAMNVKEISKRLLEEQSGIVPNDRTFLESLSGVGRKTTNVVLSNLYNEPYLAVDTHVARISKRLGIAEEKDDVREIEEKLYEFFKEESKSRLHHQLVLFGRYYCKAVKPECASCGIRKYCKNKN